MAKANGSSAAGGSPPQEGVGLSETGAFGWVYHLGVNSIGREYCHLRFLLIRGKYVEMYKRDPRENPGLASPLVLEEKLPFGASQSRELGRLTA